MSQIQIGDIITIEDIRSGYAQHTVSGYDFWICFVDNITPNPDVNDGLTFIIAERLAVSPQEARVVEILADVWPGGEGSSLPPDTYAESKRDEMNAYFLARFGETGGDPLVLWSAQVVIEVRSWRVDGITLVND